jgi:hypothetical protein
MLRTIIVCMLIGGAATGCASLGTDSVGVNYCLTDDSGFCNPLSAAGDCQPCPKSGNSTRTLSADSPVDRNQTP